MSVKMTRKFLRPPGALPEREFIATCIRCGKCAQACPYGSISLASLMDGVSIMGTPVIRARKTPCYLCLKCPPVCPSGALKRTLKRKEEVCMGTAVMNTRDCLAWQGTLCRSCFDDCPIFDEAIKMDDKLQPIVIKDKCTGCGICENVCPVDSAAISVQPGGRK